MNDSFLEDLELVSTDVKTVNAYSVDRHITTRNATSSPLQQLRPNRGENVQSEKQPKKELNTRDIKKLSEHDTKKQQIRVKTSERKDKPIESKLKPIENKVKSDGKEQDVQDESKTKNKESRTRISESKIIMKDKVRRSGSSKENVQTSDVFAKENNRPPDYSKEGTSQVEEKTKEKTKTHDVRKVESREIDPVALLNAIKDIVSICTKQESTKILKAMQELHINSQANLIKHLLCQTDDIINEMHPSKESNRVKSLIAQNERLQEDIVMLQKRNEELNKKMEEFEFLKQENIALKLKCKELSKQ
ncbi:hypothetical protein HZU67_09362 [Apis mellifera carnica]|uniref:Uncharacterized protein LOC102656433 n=1 Tax=Apis mellifera TaxID=7460 RepID=A0A7M7GM84_APIME|nr:uncharacterized protein LOC102656433 [Apis mellifera]KAG9428988.1 hypothetical protein HZU67_09362 [Apis mellifera carnica]|eukprot:XP_006560491.1 uncharacterized protein LOC102656433 [Apis mellifera]